jgi:putative chitinase
VIYLAPDQIRLVTRAKKANVEAAWPLVCAALEERGINSPLVQVGMAATIAAETGDFLPKKEVLSKDPKSPVYAAQQRYAPSGFYGRGFIQLTWKTNYVEAGVALGLDLVSDPDVALALDVAARIAAWYFAIHGLAQTCAAQDWHGLRSKVNGPGYARDPNALSRFVDHCQRLCWPVRDFNG